MSTATLTPDPPALHGGDAAPVEWVTLAQAARLLGVHPSSIQRAALAGRIRHRRSPLGIRVVYSREDVQLIAS
jgi:Helix-turn-helix domain